MTWQSILAYTIILFFNACIYAKFILIARNWKKFKNNWMKIIKTFETFGITDTRSKRSNEVILAWFFILFTCFIINLVIVYTKGFFVSTECAERQNNDTFGEFFFRKNFPEFLKIVPYHFSVGLYMLTVDVYVNSAWLFNDSFIIIISQMMTKLFELFNKKLRENLYVSFVSRNFWSLTSVVHCIIQQALFISELRAKVLARPHFDLQILIESCLCLQQAFGKFNIDLVSTKPLYRMREAIDKHEVANRITLRRLNT